MGKYIILPIFGFLAGIVISYQYHMMEMEGMPLLMYNAQLESMLIDCFMTGILGSLIGFVFAWIVSFFVD